MLENQDLKNAKLIDDINNSLIEELNEPVGQNHTIELEKKAKEH